MTESVQRAHADIERFSVSPSRRAAKHLHVAAKAGITRIELEELDWCGTV